MLTPYDWQEGIGHRAQYIEAKLAQGAPVLAISIEEGILLLSYRRQARKIYEIYDRLVYSAVGQQADVEALRNSALEFASKEGFQRSSEDVTAQRVVNAMSGPLKRAFADFGAAPVVARSLFAEVGETREQDVYYVLDYDGDYAISRDRVAVAGTLDEGARLDEALKAVTATSLSEVQTALEAIWKQEAEGERSSEGLTLEVALLDRRPGKENRFSLLSGA